jgi:hypothetical protein
VSGGVSGGKRTFIVPTDAPAFELPEGHGLKLVNGSREYVELSLPGGESSLFELERVAEEDEGVTLYVGRQMTSTGSRAFVRGSEPTTVLGYPFADD